MMAERAKRRVKEIKRFDPDGETFNFVAFSNPDEADCTNLLQKCMTVTRMSIRRA